MFASIRRYRLVTGSMDDLMHRIDESFAEQIDEQEGFVAYHVVELPDREVISISIFDGPKQAEASRELAQRWTETELQDMDLQRVEVLRSEIDVSRASEAMLEPLHAATGSEFCAVRRYELRAGSISEVLSRVDTSFAETVQGIDGFRGYMLLELGNDELVSLTFFRDRAGADASDDAAARFVSEELADFDIVRTAARSGDVHVSRARAEVLVPEHA
jgi:heme-degrading monooxygenase HmoA